MIFRGEARLEGGGDGEVGLDSAVVGIDLTVHVGPGFEQEVYVALTVRCVLDGSCV